MDNIKTKITSDQIYFILQRISSGKEKMILQAYESRLNIYRLYSVVELEKKLTKKIMFKDLSNDYSLKVDLVEALTLHDILSGVADNIIISDLFMILQKNLPQIK